MKKQKKRRGRPPKSFHEEDRTVSILRHVLGVSREAVELLVEKIPSFKNLKSSDMLIDVLSKQFPDCDLFNREEISRAGGYRDARYFYKEIATDPSSPFHLHRWGPGGICYATHVNSAQAGGRNIEETIVKRNQEGWKERSKGWKTKSDKQDESEEPIVLEIYKAE